MKHHYVFIPITAPYSNFVSHMSPTPANRTEASGFGGESVRQVQHDMDGEANLGTAVVSTVAEVAGVDPAEMDRPLYDRVDPDALDKLFSRKHDGTTRTTGRVEFSLFGYDVAVHSDGRIVVANPRTAAADASQ